MTDPISREGGRGPEQSTQQSTKRWTEHDSERFLEMARYFVPDREQQIDTVCALLERACRVHMPALVLDLACGEGVLSEAILTRFPDARVVGLDGSDVMLRRASARLGRFGERFQIARADLADRAWRSGGAAPSAVVSSLAVHHLDEPAKRELFEDVRRMLAPGGAFVVADVVRTAGESGRALAARAWDDSVRERAAANAAAYEEFRAGGWNMYAAAQPDAVDKPSTLLEQLEWLRTAGFVEVDAYWMRAGHAVFGGVAPGA